MTSLWMISVGVTDLQFPVWKKNEYGEWAENFRFESGRNGSRELHAKLLTLLEHDKIVFPDELPKFLASPDKISGLGLELELDDENGFLASVTNNRSRTDHSYRISAHGDIIPNSAETRLPVYCAKVYELLDTARASFGDQPVTVVVIGTKRDENSAEGRDEPIASAPLVARFLADKLNLEFQNNQGEIPAVLSPGTSTWFDILLGQERAENSDAQRSVVNRLSQAIRLWNSGISPDTGKIFVTTAGGIPPLKPLLERIPATCLGQKSVKLLDKPARNALADASPLTFADRIIERETIRFHCIEALRERDYLSAYGLARRYHDQPWSVEVRRLLGPLLELENYPISVAAGKKISRLMLSICQVEINLCMGNSINAIRQLGVFLETAVWELIAIDKYINEWNLKVDVGEECLIGNLPEKEYENMSNQKLLTKNKNSYEVLGLTWRWPTWLTDRSHRPNSAPVHLQKLFSCYNGIKGMTSTPRKFRNMLAHGTEIVTIGDIDKCLADNKLVTQKEQPFGKNFLNNKCVKNFIQEYGASDQIESIRAQLNQLVDKVLSVD